MKNHIRSVFCYLFIFLLGLQLALPSTVESADAAAANTSRIHFINLTDICGDNDAILLESNGHFGMVDSGEDNDYPKGSNPKYPWRTGIVKGGGHETEVISYLKSVGVKTLDFYIGTHPHSDHIGSADEIIRAFKPARVYIMEYKDSYIKTDARRWDNRYVYDNMLRAAEETGATLIQKFSTSAKITPKSGTTGNPNFKLGSMKIQIVNYNQDYKKKKSDDANEFSLGVKVTANGKTAFLSGDIGNWDGDENRLAAQLGHINILKLGHHGYTGSNSPTYLKSLNPEYVMITGSYTNMPTSTISVLDSIPNLHLYTTTWYAPLKKATVFTLGTAITTNVPTSATFYAYDSQGNTLQYQNGVAARVTSGKGWTQNGGNWYYFNENGSMAKGWLNFNNKWYYLNGNGIMTKGWLYRSSARYYFNGDGTMATGWKQISKKWYYFGTSGAATKGWATVDKKKRYFKSDYAMATGFTKISGKTYYFQANGALVTGFKTISGKTYYFAKNGVMKTGLVTIGSKIYYFNSKGVQKTGWQTVKKKIYYFNKNGVKKTGWQTISGKRYYFLKGGYVQTGTKKINGRTYVFDNKGVLKQSDSSADQSTDSSNDTTSSNTPTDTTDSTDTTDTADSKDTTDTTGTTDSKDTTDTTGTTDSKDTTDTTGTTDSKDTTSTTDMAVAAVTK